MTKEKSDSTGADTNRRRFIKKAAYTAPALISMGMLSGTALATERKRVSRTENDCDDPNPINCDEPSGPNAYFEEPESALGSRKQEWS